MLNPRTLAPRIAKLRFNAAPPPKLAGTQQPMRLLRWTGRKYALQAKLACLCPAGYTQAIAPNGTDAAGSCVPWWVAGR